MFKNKNFKKVTVVGAGAVGASSAEYIAIKTCFWSCFSWYKRKPCQGKAMDLMQTASLNGFDTKIIGSKRLFENCQ